MGEATGAAARPEEADPARRLPGSFQGAPDASLAETGLHNLAPVGARGCYSASPQCTGEWSRTRSQSVFVWETAHQLPATSLLMMYLGGYGSLLTHTVAYLDKHQETLLLLVRIICWELCGISTSSQVLITESPAQGSRRHIAKAAGALQTWSLLMCRGAVLG